MKKLMLTVVSMAFLLSILPYIATEHFASGSMVAVLAPEVLPTVPSIAWNRTYLGSNLEFINSVIQTADGGFLLAAEPAIASGSNIELVKVDSMGNLQWNKTYIGTSRSLFGRCLIQTSEGGYAIAGQYAGGGWLGKIDAQGNLQWNQTYIGTGTSSTSAVTQTSDGGYALTGGSSSVWLLKTDASGNALWNKTLAAGGAISIIQTSDGGYAVAGGIGNLPDYLLIKANSAGDLQWTKTYGSADEDYGYSVLQTSDGGYAEGGWMWLRSNGGGLNIAVVKTDALGNAQWTKYYGGGQGWCMTNTTDGGIAIAGTSLVKVDSAGNEEWSVNFQISNPNINQADTILEQQIYSVTQTQDGGYAVAGSSIYYGGHPVAFLAKIDLVTGAQYTPQPSPTSSYSPSSSPSPTLSPSASPTPPPPSPAETPTTTISPTPSVPEFPQWVILPLATITILTILLEGKKQRKSNRLSAL